MSNQEELSFRKKVGLFFGRFGKIPSRFIIVIGIIFGIADFLTWSVLRDIPQSDRLQWTFVFFSISIVVAVVGVLRTPTSDERFIKARALYRKGRDYYENHDYQRTISSLEKAVELDPENSAALGLLGRVYVRQGIYQNAISSLTNALELAKINKPFLLHLRGMAYAMSGSNGRALDDFDDSLREDPKRTVTLRWRALVWLYLGRSDNSLKDIDLALLEKPRYLCGRATKAAILAVAGDYKNAKLEIKKCNELGPQDADDLYCLALAYSQLGPPYIKNALNALKVSIQRNSKYRARSLIEPLFANLKTDTQFREILGNNNSV